MSDAEASEQDEGIGIRTASDRALMVDVRDLDAGMRLHAALERLLAEGGLEGVTELIPAARTVLVRFDPLRASASALAEAVRAVRPGPLADADARHLTIRTRYDGEDLSDAARLLGVTADELVARHTGAQWRVAFSGFAPGFGYMACDDPLFDVPRRPSPRTRVPAGAVALAGGFTGVYPRSSPGGWQLIGHTDLEMWDIDRDPPALLAPGTIVRFEPTRERAVASAQRPAHAPHTGAHALEVVRPALQMLVQDLGRPGHAALGVSASGAADRTALREANRAVGNAPGEAAIEIVGGGGAFRVRGAGVAAVAGATPPVTVVDRAGAVTPVAHGVPFSLEDGDEIRLGAPTTGLRTVMALRGGVSAAAALGSRSTDTLAGLGPAALGAGDVIPLGDPRSAPAAVDPVAPAREPLPSPGDVVSLEVTLGPRDDWFTSAAVRALEEQEWLVTPRSDRVGIRVHGDTPLERARAGELPSEGSVTGAIQVPADGQPVLFLADHPLTGGYPIIGAVVDRCLDLAGQLPPGARIRFRIVES